ncbi:hypothetical protein SAMN02745166_05155, partial [Prosthecobacter debontii]
NAIQVKHIDDSHGLYDAYGPLYNEKCTANRLASNYFLICLARDQGDAAQKSYFDGGLVIKAKEKGAAGNEYRITFVGKGHPNKAFATSLSGKRLIVQFKTNSSGAVLTNFGDIRDRINSYYSNILLASTDVSTGLPSANADSNLSGGGLNRKVLATDADVAEALNGLDNELEVSSSNGVPLNGVPLSSPATSLTGGADEEEIVHATAGEVAEFIAQHAGLNQLVEINGGGEHFLSPAVLELSGGGANPSVKTSRQDLMELLAGDTAVSNLITVAGESDPNEDVQWFMQPLLRTVFTGGRCPGSVSTGDQVAGFLNEDPVARQVVKVFGGGPGKLHPSSITLSTAIDPSHVRVSLGTSSGDAARLLDQGLIYRADVPGVAGNTMTLRLEEHSEAEQPLSASLDGDEIVVQLATDSGLHDRLVNQDITYLQKASHQAGQEVSVALLTEVENQSPGVIVDGREIKVLLETGAATKASVTDQGITYQAWNAGLDGNRTRVRLRAADAYESGALEWSQFYQDSAWYNDVVVNLPNSGGAFPYLVLPGMVYIGSPGTVGNGLTIRHQVVPGESQTRVEMVEDELIVYLAADEGDTATASLYNGAITLQASEPGVAGNSRSYAVYVTNEPSQPLQSGTEGNLVWVSVATDEEGNSISTMNDVAAALGGYVWGFEGGDIVTYGEDVNLSGGGANMTILTDDYAIYDAIIAHPVASTLIRWAYTGFGGTLGNDSGVMSGGVAPTSFDMDVDDVVALLNGALENTDLMTVTGSGSAIVQPATFYLTGGDNQPTVETTIDEVVEMLTEDEEASALIDVTYTGDGEAVAAPMALTKLDGGRGPGSISTSAQVRTYLNAHETIGARITVNGGGANVVGARNVMAFHGGGANPQVTTTASDLVALLGADASAQELVEVTGAGSTPLQPLPRTALTGVKDKPP